MAGVVFLIVVPTANFERELIHGQQLDNNELVSNVPMSSCTAINTSGVHGHCSGVAGGGIVGSGGGIGGSNLNINIPDNNAILRLEVELRDKNACKQQRRGAGGRCGGGGGKRGRGRPDIHNKDNFNVVVPMEKILEELLIKLEIDHVTWSSDKKGNYYHVVFPLQSGEPCETTLHCLTELGIGIKLNSSVSVLPCSVSYDAITNNANTTEDSDDDGEELSKWNNFVESIKSKLTVKQVVDGVRAGGSLSFDYILLIVTADSLAALGLVENNAPNIVAAMLVSPLMGPVMSITFGTIISDRELMKVGFMTLAVGIFISLLFGFIFGLILGTTDMPWGFSDWPTEEMRGRGNVRSLWMGVVWALTSGTGVAVALLQGSVGPLIGVAISASLLPPVVNCGLFWALACIWLIYPDIKMPHLKGESYVGNSSYPFIYTNYLPTEFFINGIVSGCLTIINIICIFITAVIVLKIKEVSAPYTASPDLKRFWETDIRTARKTNRSTIRRGGTFKDRLLSNYPNDAKNRELKTVLEHALQEAANDETFRKVKRMSYLGNAAGELTHRLGLNKNDGITSNSGSGSQTGSVRNSKINADLQALDRLVSTLLEHHNLHSDTNTSKKNNYNNSNEKKGSVKLNRLRPFSRSLTGLIGRNSGSIKSFTRVGVNNTVCNSNDPYYHGNNNVGVGGSGNVQVYTSTGIQHSSLMPTIMEQQNQMSPNNNTNRTSKMSWPDKKTSSSSATSPSSSAAQTVRGVLNTIANAPQRFSQSLGQNDEENINLTQNILE